MLGQLSVFQLYITETGIESYEPVTLFLLTDCLEIARPRKRNTSDNHAIQAALAAVESELVLLGLDVLGFFNC